MAIAAVFLFGWAVAGAAGSAPLVAAPPARPTFARPPAAFGSGQASQLLQGAVAQGAGVQAGRSAVQVPRLRGTTETRSVAGPASLWRFGLPIDGLSSADAKPTPSRDASPAVYPEAERIFGVLLLMAFTAAGARHWRARRATKTDQVGTELVGRDLEGKVGTESIAWPGESRLAVAATAGEAKEVSGYELVFQGDYEKAFEVWRRQVAKKAFLSFDLDGDGKLDLKEVYAAVLYVVVKINGTPLSVSPPPVKVVKEAIGEKKELDFEEFDSALIVLSKDLIGRSAFKTAVKLLTPLFAYAISATAGISNTFGLAIGTVFLTGLSGVAAPIIDKWADKPSDEWE